MRFANIRRNFKFESVFKVLEDFLFF
jgi:hypothetical protein